ncbi:MAG: DUF3556 domain-containing protein [Solirubrobacterales bacterium]
MGFIAPDPPPFDVEDWKRKSHLERIKPLAQDWAVNGVGTPYAVYLLYAVKLVVFSLAAILIIGLATPGLGGPTELGDWWTQPIVWQKLVVWMILWEMLGLGSGSMPLTFRFLPPIGGPLYWLRPGTIRLPPWPDRVPFTRGTKRTIFDVALFAGVLLTAGYLLLSGGTDVSGIGGAGKLSTTGIAILLAFLAILGLRDKVSGLCSRPEIYGVLLIVFLFPLDQMIVASQFVLFFVWWGAASSKLNHHFPNVVAVMVSNTPWNRVKFAKKRLYRDYPDDLRPSREAAFFAHLGTVIEFALPLVLIASSGGTIGMIAVAGMVIFHVHILSTFPLAVPLEWNLFMIFGVLFLFGHYGTTPLSTLDDPLLIAILLVCLVGIPIYGNLRPDKVSFLPAMRYYAGNWPTSQWLFRNDSKAEQRMDETITKSAGIVHSQLSRIYDADTADVLLTKGLAFRSLHNQGRALNGLAFRAVDNLDEYTVREGELVGGTVVGWNFGDGHFHGKQLLDAVQERCHFKPGELRVVTMESQPAQRQTQQYEIWDAASGLVEAGTVKVADMRIRQPWLDESNSFPVAVTGGPGAGTDSTDPANT